MNDMGPRGRIAPPDFDWTGAAVTRLLALWAEGWSATEIGIAMGCSRNAVIGKVHRLAAEKTETGEVLRPELLRRAGQRAALARKPKASVVPPAPKAPARKSPPRPKPGAMTAGTLLAAPRFGAARESAGPADADLAALRGAAWAPLDGPEPVPIEDLGDGCKWPLGDPLAPGFGFCGLPHEAGGVYCARHRALAYTPAPARPPAPVQNHGPGRGDRQFARALQ